VNNIEIILYIIGGDDLTPSLLRLFEDEMKSSISPACLASSNWTFNAFSRSGFGSTRLGLQNPPWAIEDASSKTNDTFLDPPPPSEMADLFRYSSFALEMSTDLHGTLWLESFLFVGPSSKIGENVTRDIFLDAEEFELILDAVDTALVFLVGGCKGKSDWLKDEEFDSMDTTHVVLGFLLYEALSDVDCPTPDDIEVRDRDEMEDPLLILPNRF